MNKNTSNKIFTRLLPTQTPYISKSQIITLGIFSKIPIQYPISKSKQTQNRLLALTDSHIIYYQDQTINKVKRICQLTFQTKFQIIRQQWKDPRTPGHPIGLKFEKQGYIPISLFSDNTQLLNMWKDQLEKKINQRGFHSLFKPIKKIGKGNFASVYLAQRLQDGKLVAVKAFSKEAVFSQEKGKESLTNEINLMRRLSHNNVMRLYGVFESENSIYMTVQYLQGGQLFSKIQSKHQFLPQQVKKIMKGLLLGLQQMHSKRIMHRDLKPQNILLRYRDDYEVVIADFGLAAWSDQEKYLFVRCGTPGYVAPQIVNIKNMNTKSEPICDIFSIGLIFHILLVGKSIFPGKTYNEVLAQNRACDFNLQTQQYKSLLQQSAHNLLIKMLDTNPSTRISAADALKHEYFCQMQIQQVEKQQISLKKKFYIQTPLIKTTKQSIRQDSCVKFVHKLNYNTSPKHEQIKSVKIGKQNNEILKNTRNINRRS